MLLFHPFWLLEKNHSLVCSGKKNLISLSYISSWPLAYTLIILIKKKQRHKGLPMEQRCLL